MQSLCMPLLNSTSSLEAGPNYYFLRFHGWLDASSVYWFDCGTGRGNVRILPAICGGCTYYYVNSVGVDLVDKKGVVVQNWTSNRSVRGNPYFYNGFTFSKAPKFKLPEVEFIPRITNERAFGLTAKLILTYNRGSKGEAHPNRFAAVTRMDRAQTFDEYSKDINDFLKRVGALDRLKVKTYDVNRLSCKFGYYTNFLYFVLDDYGSGASAVDCQFGISLNNEMDPLLRQYATSRVGTQFFDFTYRGYGQHPDIISAASDMLFWHMPPEDRAKIGGTWSG